MDDRESIPWFELRDAHELPFERNKDTELREKFVKIQVKKIVIKVMGKTCLGRWFATDLLI